MVGPLDLGRVDYLARLYQPDSLVGVFGHDGLDEITVALAYGKTRIREIPN